MGKSSFVSQTLSVNKSFLHSGCHDCFQPGNYFGRKHSSVLYCFWKRGLCFWHGDGLFSPGQNGKSDVFSETPIERIEEGKREDQLEAKGGSFGDQGERWIFGGLERKPKMRGEKIEIFFFFNILPH